MAILGSSFSNAYEDSIDRSKKRRSENMEAFNSFVKMQSELGIDANTQDLERMKASLAGGNTYFGQGLPSTEVLEATSTRLGEIKADKNAREASTRLANQQSSDNRIFSLLDRLKGTNAGDEKAWEKLSKSPAVMGAGELIGLDAVRELLKARDQTDALSFIQNNNLKTLTDPGAQATVLTNASDYMKPTLTTHFTNINNRNLKTSQQNAVAKADTQILEIFKGAANAEKAADALMAVAKQTFDPDVNYNGRENAAWVADLRQRYVELFANYQGDFFSQALVVADTTENTGIVSATEEQQLSAARLILAQQGSMNPTDDQVRDIRERLVSSNRVRLDKVEQVSVKNVETSIREYDLLLAEDYVINAPAGSAEKAKFDNQIETFMLQTEIDFDTPKYKKKNGYYTQDYFNLKDKITNLFTSRVSEANDEEFDRDSDAFRIAVDQDTEATAGAGSLESMMKARFANPKDNVFIRMNTLRKINRLPEFANQQDPEFIKLFAAWEQKAGAAITAQYNKKRAEVTRTAEAALEATMTSQEGQLGAFAGENGSVEYTAMSILNGMYIVGDQLGVAHSTIMNELDRRGVASMDDMTQTAAIADVVNTVAATMGYKPNSENGRTLWKADKINTQMKGMILPGTYMGTYLDSLAKKYIGLAERTMAGVEAVPVDATPTEIKLAQDRLVKAKDALVLLRKNARADVQGLALKSLLDLRGVSSASIILAFDNQIGAIEKKLTNGTIVPSAPPSFLAPLSNGQFEVNIDHQNSGRAAALGFQVGAIYEIDVNSVSPKGYKQVAAATTQRVRGRTELLPGRSNLAAIGNASMKDTWNKVFDKYNNDPAQQQMLNLILGNAEVAAYLTLATKNAERRDLFKDPIAWFNNIARSGDQLTRGGGSTRAVEERSGIERRLEQMSAQQNGSP
jgi:hypothetical protein